NLICLNIFSFISSYFTMVAKDYDGKNTNVPGLILSSQQDIKRFINCIKQISLKKERNLHEIIYDYKSEKALEELKKYNVKLEQNQ
ncbi:MAG TPA: hypothetical protein PKH91_10620, partial [Flavobacterium sp.]|nr:hypothetical protein [Flavobacterium sp.]